ncbi:hypothetical protein ACIBQ1_06530 [Nonomuraea sp. NPDC050153]|uniref:hypothetical protein n=1 Tax=Nonomuraea sp. NPDC050153 TaxID=3364359 RepID=UPI0037A23E7D
MADYLQSAPAKPTARRGYALAVVVAGALLVFCAVLPWAGLEVRSELIGGGLANDIRGIDDTYGVYTLVSGLVALGCGVAGLLTHPRVAALAALPGAVAAAVLVLFMTDGSGVRDRLSVDLGQVLSIGPTVKFGWFAAMGCAVAIVVLSVLALVRRA